jgi:uncharacterized membrane protein
MVLGLRVPAQHDLAGFVHSTGHAFITYILSFGYVAIYWKNHHHLFHVVDRVSAPVLWSNLVLLFFLSLVPFTTAWMAESSLARTPLVVYGANLLMAGTAYVALLFFVVRQEGVDEPLRHAIGRDLRFTASPALYLVGILSVLLIEPHGAIGKSIALACYAAVAVLWVVPDRRIDRAIHDRGGAP